MSKDYIGKKKKGGIAGIVFFCAMAFVLTFVISYSYTNYKNTIEKTKLSTETKQDKLSEELDRLFAEKEQKEPPRKSTEPDVKKEPAKKLPSVTVAQPDEIEEVVVDVEVSAKPQKAVVPIVEGAIKKKFSTTPEYSDFFEDWRSHTGIDISGNEGDEVRTIADGTVVEAYIDPLSGGTMKIDHGAFYSVYMGLDPENMEMKGTVVKRGDTIGLLQGKILGENTETHLHFEIMENEIYIDPMKYIG